MKGYHFFGRGFVLLSSCFLSWQIANGEGVRYLHTDHLGSTSLATNQNAEVVESIDYTPFGEILTPHPSPSPQRGEGWGEGASYLFTGQELDPESSLYYYGARYYDPFFSRFLSRDPILNEPSYAYVNNHPISFVDPDGQQTSEPKGPRYAQYLDPTPNTAEIRLSSAGELLVQHDLDMRLVEEKARNLIGTGRILQPENLGEGIGIVMAYVRGDEPERILLDGHHRLAALIRISQLRPDLLPPDTLIRVESSDWKSGETHRGSALLRNEIWRMATLGEHGPGAGARVADTLGETLKIGLLKRGSGLLGTAAFSLIIFGLTRDASAFDPLGAEELGAAPCERYDRSCAVGTDPQTLEQFRVAVPECDDYCQRLESELERLGMD
jgi:RHS repeat-associated protein